jgi:WD40 repeat protein
MTVATLPTSPYKGLAPFEDTDLDALLFFGREREQEVIASNLIASRLTVLYGPTGVGKSSVLRAGVAYRLRGLAERAIEERGHPDLAVVVFDDWRGEPLAELRTAVEEELGRLFGPFAVPDAAPHVGLAETLSTWTSGLECELLLILDQVEEYFVYHPADDDGEPFAEQLSQLVTTPSLRVNVMLSLREDALGRLDRFKAQIPNLLSNYLRLDRLPEPAARAAIVGPLERYNELVGPDRAVAVEPDLVDAIIEQTTVGRVDLGPAARGATVDPHADGVETAYLQLVLARVWDEEQRVGSRTLRADTLEELGSAGEIVRGHVRRALDSLDVRGKDVAATIFNYLVTPSGTKIAHSLADLENYAEGEADAVDAVVAALSRERVLRSVAAPGNGKGDSGAGYEIFHDVLAVPVLAWRRQHEQQRALERQRRESERRHRRSLIVSAVSVAALAVMAAVTVYALVQRHEADQQARVALARELTASAFAKLPADPDLSLLLAREAAKREPTIEVEDALRQALLASRARDVIHARVRATLREPRGRATAEVSPNGHLIAASGVDSKVRVFDAASGRPYRTLRHPARATMAVFGPYPDWVLTGAADRVARLWRLRTARVVAAFSHGAALTAVAFGAHGRIATAGSDRTLQIWWVGTGGGRYIRLLARPAKQLAFSPDGSLVLAVTGGSTVPVFDAEHGNPLYTLRHPRAITSATFSPSGTRIVTTSVDRTARVWETRFGRMVRPLRGHGGPVTSAAISKGGKLVATGSTDGAVRVFNASNGRRIAKSERHEGPITDVQFSSDGTRIVAVGRDGMGRVREAETADLLAVLGGGREAVTSVAFAAEGNTVVTEGKDGRIRVWDPAADPQLVRLGGHPHVTTAVFSAEGKRAASGGNDGNVRIWNVEKQHLLAKFHVGGEITAVAFSPEGARVAVGGTRGARLLAVGRPARMLVGAGPTVDVAFSPDGTLLLTGATRGAARLWDVASGKRLRTLPHRGLLEDVAFARDGGTALTAARNGSVRIWDVERGSVRHVLHHGAPIVSAKFNAEGNRIVTAGDDAQAVIWDVATGDALRHLKGDGGHRGPLTDASFSPDGRLVVTASEDHDARIWNARSGKLTFVLEGHKGTVRLASFSADGRWIVTAARGSAGLWQTRTGTRLLLLGGHLDSLVAATFAPNSARVLTAAGGIDGTVRTYVCVLCGGVREMARLAEARVRRQGRALTPAERRRYLHEGA